jgi:hypothetical protein
MTAKKAPAAKRPAKQAKPENIIAIRESIRARALVSLLEDHAFGLVTLTNAQVNSVRCLLDRRLPSLRAMEVTGQADSNITISWQK